MVTSGRVNSCKVSPKVGCLPWGKRPILSLVWKKDDVVKINGDDDDDFVFHIFRYNYQNQHKNVNLKVSCDLTS